MCIALSRNSQIIMGPRSSTMNFHRLNCPFGVTIRFKKIVIQGKLQIAVDKEPISLSRVYSYYSKCHSQLTIYSLHCWFEYKQTLKSEHSQTASRFKDISPKVASAGLAIYSGLHQIILHSPSTPSTRGQRDGRDHVEPLARDGVTSSEMT